MKQGIMNAKVCNVYVVSFNYITSANCDYFLPETSLINKYGDHQIHDNMHGSAMVSETLKFHSLN